MEKIRTNGKRGEKSGSRPVSRVLSRTVIHLGCASPHTSSNLPGNSAGRTNVPLFGLAPGGVYLATIVTDSAVRSYRHHFTLTGLRRDLGGIFSAALSVGFRLPGVTWHPALWSPDFPPLHQSKAATVRPTPTCKLIRFPTDCKCNPIKRNLNPAERITMI